MVQKASGAAPTVAAQHVVAHIGRDVRMNAIFDTGATISQTHSVTKEFFVDFDESRQVKGDGAGGVEWQTEGEGTVLM